MAAPGQQQPQQQGRDFGTELAADVEVLIENISSLLLDTVTGQFANLEVYCKSIAEYTNKVVVKARDNALNSNDQEFLDESTQCIKDIASSINRLVEALSSVLAKPKEPASQTEFAAASKAVGDAINKLVILSDETYQQRLLKAVADAQATSNRVRDSAYHSIDEMIVAVKDNGSRCLYLCKLCNRAASETVDQQKKKMLTTGSEQLKRLSPDLLLAAKRVLENRPGDGVAAKEHLERKTQDISVVFDRIAEAAKIVPSTTRKLQGVLEHVRNLINLANELKKATAALMAGVAAGEPKAKIDELRRRVAELSEAIIKEVELAGNAGDQSEYRQRQITQTVKNLQEAQRRFFKALDELAANSSSQPAKNDLGEAETALSRNINQLITLSDPNAPPAARLALTLQDVERLAKELTDKLPTATKEEILAMAKDLEAATLQFIKDAEALLEDITDPKERQILSDHIEKVKEEVSQLLSAAKTCAENRGDAAARERFTKASKSLAESTARFKRHLEELNATREITGGDNLSEARKKLLRNALVAKQTAEEILAQTNPSDTVAVAKRLGEAVLGLTKAAEEASVELPAGVKPVASAQIQEMKKVGAELLTATKSFIMNPQNEATRGNTGVAVLNFTKSVDTLLSRFVNDEEELGRKHKVLASASDAMLNAVRDGSAAGLVASAKALAENVAQLEAQVEKLMAEPDTHPSKRAAMVGAMKDLKASSAAFVSACKAAVTDPKNPKNWAAANETRSAFNDKLQKVIEIVTTRKQGEEVLTKTVTSPSVSVPPPVANDHELVIIAKEQVTIAFQMADEAAALSAKETNAAKKQKILSAVDGVRSAGAEVLAAANDVSADPFNSTALRRLDSSQVTLTNAISTLAGVTSDAASGREEEELRRAMKDMDVGDKGAAEGELIVLAHKTTEMIARFLEVSSTSKDARFIIEKAKEIHMHTNQLAGLLRTKANNTSDPLYREQLLNFAKILRDKAMQVKILSAVQVASQKADDERQVASCTAGLATTIKDTLATLHESALKERVKAARGRVEAIRNLLNLWRRKR